MKKKYKVHKSHFSVFMYVYISLRSVFGSASTGHNRQVQYLNLISTARAIARIFDSLCVYISRLYHRDGCAMPVATPRM